MSERLRGIQSPKFWDYIAVNADDDIQAGGWYSSFGGKPFSSEEMNQYKENTFMKLQPYLSKEKTVIEIGCASGLTMFYLAPYVGKYIGTDMAKENLVRNKKRIERNPAFKNIVLQQCSADQVKEKVDAKADIVIMNSVCQYFPHMQYFEMVISSCLSMLKSGGVLYIGDLLDKEVLPDFVDELNDWQKEHPNAGPVKIDRSDELWVERNYFMDIDIRYELIHHVEISDKIGKISNELIKYRYDVVIFLK